MRPLPRETLSPRTLSRSAKRSKRLGAVGAGGGGGNLTCRKVTRDWDVVGLFVPFLVFAGGGGICWDFLGGHRFRVIHVHKPFGRVLLIHHHKHVAFKTLHGDSTYQLPRELVLPTMNQRKELCLLILGSILGSEEKYLVNPFGVLCPHTSD